MFLFEVSYINRIIRFYFLVYMRGGLHYDFITLYALTIGY